MQGKYAIKYFAGSGPGHSASCSFTLLFPNIDLTILNTLGKEQNVNNPNYLCTSRDWKNKSWETMSCLFTFNSRV